MKPAEKPEFAALLTDALGFYRQDVSKFALGVWWQACERFDLEQVAKALTAHALDPERGQFPPKPADVIRALQGTATDRSLIAWGKVLEAMRIVGAYRSVVFDDGAIHAAIEDIGGWITACRTEVDELPFLQRRFTDAHKAYSARPDFPFPAMLVGEFDLTNRLHGHETPQPVLVGDAPRARLVLAAGTAGPKTTITVGDAMPAVKRLGKAAL